MPPMSDKFKYNVGDRIKSNVTQEDGRVINIVVLGEGALLITVAIFVGGILRNNKSFVQKIGQVAGLEWQVVSSAVGEGISKTPLITSPIEGGTVSAEATRLAQANQPINRSVTRTLADRLKAWEPKLADRNDEESYIRAVKDKIDDFNRKKDGVFRRKGHTDLLLNYLTSTGHKDGQGQWVGGYITEHIHNAASASAKGIELGGRLEAIIKQTGIPVELRLLHKGLIPEGITNAWDLLVHAKQRVKGLSYTEAGPILHDYMEIIKSAVDLSPGRKRQRDVIEALTEASDYLYGHLSDERSGSWSTGPSVREGVSPEYIRSLAEAAQKRAGAGDPTRFAVEGGITSPEVSARSMHELEVKMFGGKRGTRERRFETEAPGVVRKATIPKFINVPTVGGGVLVERGQTARPVRKDVPITRTEFPLVGPKTGSYYQGRLFIDSPVTVGRRPPYGEVPSTVTNAGSFTPTYLLNYKQRQAAIAETLAKGARYSTVPVTEKRLGRGIDPFDMRGEEPAGPILTDTLEGARTLGKDIGERTTFRKEKTGRPKVSGGSLHPSDLFRQVTPEVVSTTQTISTKSGELRVPIPTAPGRWYRELGAVMGGKNFVFFFNNKGAPNIIKKIDSVLKTVDMQPLSANIELRGTDIIGMPGRAIAAIKGAGQRAAGLPLAADAVAQKAGVVAKQTAARLAARKTIAIRGGLLGTTDEVVKVPMDLLREYVGGATTFKDVKTLQRAGAGRASAKVITHKGVQAAGFRGVEAFIEGGRSFSGRLERTLRERLVAHPEVVARTLTGTALAQHLEEVMSGARLAVFEHLGIIQGSRSIEQIEAELLNVGVRRGIALARDPGISVAHQTFTELGGLEDEETISEGVIESKVSKLESIAARETEGAARLGPTNFIMEHELRERAQAFREEVERIFPEAENFVAYGKSKKIPGEHRSRYIEEVKRILGVEGATRSESSMFGAGPSLLNPESAVVGRTRKSDIVNEVEQAEIDKLLQLGISAETIAGYTPKTIGTPTAQKNIREFARSLGGRITHGNRRMQDAYTRLQLHMDTYGPSSPKTQEAAREYMNLREAHIETVQERYLRRKAGVPAGVRELNPRTVPLTEEQIPLYKAALSLPPDQQAQALRELGIHTTVSRGKVEAIVHSESGEAYALQEIHGGLAAVSVKDPHRAVFMGGAEQTVTLGEEELARAIKAREFIISKKTKEQAEWVVRKAEQESFARTFTTPSPSDLPIELPIFRAGNKVVGFAGNDLVNATSVIENAKAVAEGKRARLFIDIEKSRETAGITMFGIHRYEKIGGEWVETLAEQIATPEFTKLYGVSLVDPIRKTYTRFGAEFAEPTMVSSEQHIAQRAAAIFEKYKDDVVIGHNVAHDISTLAAVESTATAYKGILAATKAQVILKDVARNRVTDTVFLTQLSHPDQQRLGLAELGKTLSGNERLQEHIPSFDIPRTAALVGEIDKRSEQVLADLASIERVPFEHENVLFAKQGVNKGRAFKIKGFLDTEAASEAYYQQIGKSRPYGQQELGIGFAAELQPINFLTGAAEGPTVLDFAATPHHYARAFTGTYDIHPNITAAREHMETAAADYARKRVRRIVSEEAGFTNLLSDIARLPLAKAAVEGPEALAVARDAVIAAKAETTSHFGQNILDAALKYSETYAKDTRILRQFELERGFLEGEVGKTHRPVVEWLAAALANAPRENIRETSQVVNQMWRDYMTKVEEHAPRPHIPVEATPTVALDIPILGGHQRALLTSSEQTLRKSLQQHTFNIARKIQDEPDFRALLQGEEADTVRALINRGANFLDTDLGAKVEQHIFEKHIGPAMEAGFVEKVGTAEGERAPLQIRAGSVNEAVSSILSRVGDIVHEHKTTAIDYLVERVIPTDTLAAIHREIGVGGDIVPLASRVTTPENMKVALHHHAPATWHGKHFEDLIETALLSSKGEQEEFAGRLRGMYTRMGTGEQEVLAQIIKRKAAVRGSDSVLDLLNTVVGTKKVPSIVVPSAPVRTFNAGGLTNVGVEIGEAVATNAKSLKIAGLVSLGIVSAGVAMLATRPRTSHSKTNEEESKEQILHSTESEVARRKERIANQVAQHNRINVNIFANDPQGVNHEELTESIHSTLGTFLGREIQRSTVTNDNRGKIDRGYIDRVASSLLTRAAPVG